MVMISGGAFDCPEVYDLRGLTDIEVATNIRHSVAQALATHYKVPQELPPEFRKLLSRLDRSGAAS